MSKYLTPKQAISYGLKAKSSLGFTLVETIVYVAVVGVLVVAISNVTLGMLNNYRTASTKDELALSANEVFGFFFREVKNAKDIYLPASTLDNDLGALTLDTTFGFGDEVGVSAQVSFYLSDGKIMFKREGETALALTPDGLEVTQFKFVRVVPKLGLEGVRFYLNLKNKHRANETFSLTTFAMLRGGYIK